MSARNAIMARFGADAKDFLRELKATEKATETTMGRIRNEAGKTGRAMDGMHGSKSGGHGGGGHGKGGGGAVGSRMAGDALDAATGQKGWVMRMQMLQHALPLAAVGALAGGLAKVVEAMDKVHDATKEARQELNKPLDAQALNPEAAKKSLEGMTEQIAKVRASRMMDKDGLFAGQEKIGARLGDMIFGTTNVQDSKNTERALLDRKRDLASRFKVNVEEEAEARDQAAHSSEREVELLKIKQKAVEEIAGIRTSVDPAMQDAEIGKVQHRQALEVELANHKADARDRELDLENSLVALRQTGRNVAIEEAKARKAAAQEEYDKAITVDERVAARGKIGNAAQQLRDATRQTAELRAQQAIATAIADLHATTEVKAYTELVRMGAELQRQTIGATADERAKLNVLIAQNAEKQRAAQFAATEKSFGLAGSLIDATKGRGEAAELQNLLQHRGNKANELAFLERSPLADPAQIASARKELRGMDNQITDMIEKRNLGLIAAHGETAALKLQLQHQDVLSQMVKTVYDYEAKIAQAKKDKSFALVAELETQKQITLQLQARSAINAVNDKSKGTLGELAKHAHNADGMHARHIARLEKREDRFRQRGHAKEADALADRADRERLQIGALKEADKDEARRNIAARNLRDGKGVHAGLHPHGGGADAKDPNTEILTEIKNATQKMADNMGKAL